MIEIGKIIILRTWSNCYFISDMELITLTKHKWWSVVEVEPLQSSVVLCCTFVHNCNTLWDVRNKLRLANIRITKMLQDALSLIFDALLLKMLIFVTIFARVWRIVFDLEILLLMCKYLLQHLLEVSNSAPMHISYLIM